MPGILERFGHGVQQRIDSIPRRILARNPLARPIVREEVLLTSTAGYRLSCCVHRPVRMTGPAPGVLLCPGIDDPGEVFHGVSQPISADEVARLGIVTMHFDPAGRGKSWGNEDFGGLEQQDDVRTVLRYLVGRSDVVPSRSGVVAISLGISMAVGGLAQGGETCPIGWLIDWEGPSDREIITAGGRILVPADGHSNMDDTYWKPREAVLHIGKVRCGYLRFQSIHDHAQPGEFRHAQRMIRAAREGGLPWFRLNDHPLNVIPEEPTWYPAGYRAANRILLARIAELTVLRPARG